MNMKPNNMSKKAQVTSLVIVLLVLAGLGAGAYFLSEGMGSEVTGFDTYTGGCGGFIDQEGTWYLNEPIGPCSANGIIINKSDVILDCQDNSITGSGTGAGSAGIFMVPDEAGNVLTNVTVQNCNIEDFATGIINGFILFGLYPSNYAKLLDNTISSVNMGIGVVMGNYTLISGNDIDATEKGIELWFANHSNITKNTLRGTIADLNISSYSYLNKVWLNNFYEKGIVENPAGATYCVEEEDNRIRDVFGNYYDSGITVRNTGCGSDSPTLPEPYEGPDLPVYCGATVIDDLTLERDLANQTHVEDATCAGNGFEIGADDVDINCAGHNIVGIDGDSQYGIASNSNTGLTVEYCNISNFHRGINWKGAGATIFKNTIHDNGGWGVLLFNGADNFNVTDNNIFNNLMGVRLYAADGGDIESNNLHDNSEREISVENSDNINITRNKIENKNSSGGWDVYLDSSSIGSKLYLNRFLGQGVYMFAGNSFCYGGDGNFYRYTIPQNKMGADDCGPVNISLSDSPYSDSRWPDFYNISSLRIEWDEQDSFLSPVTYYLNVYNNTDEQYYQVYYDGEPGFDWDTKHIFNHTSFNVSITPFDSEFNGTYFHSLAFNISNDLDNDAFSVLDYYKSSDSWDCDDTNSSVHQPKWRENSSSPYVANACFNTVDDDCDVGISGYTTGGVDWLDHGCGHGFTPGPFNDTLYTNGTIRNINTARINTGTPPRYYALIENEWGKVEYKTETNLTGVNLGSIFDIDYNSITGDPAAPDGDRFDKSSKITFRQLTGYHKIPTLLVDGEPCTPDVCSNQVPDPNEPVPDPFTGTLSFSASHFSTFSTTNNSKLHIFTQADPESAAYSTNYPQEMETYHRLRFFANYTKFPSGDPINDETGGYADQYNDGSCTIKITDPSGNDVTGTDYIVESFDFNSGTTETWSHIDPSFAGGQCLDVYAEYLDPVMQHVLKVELKDSAGPAHECYVLIPDGLDAPANELLFDDLSAKLMNITFKARSNVSGGVNVSVNLSQSMAIFSAVHNVTDGWQVFNLSVQLAPGSDTGTLWFEFDNSSGQDYAVWIDDIIVYTNRTGVMQYDDFYGLYVYESGVNDFEDPSDYYRYNVSCVSDIYEPHNLTERFSVVEDTTPPDAPILYPQILLYPSNLTDEMWTYVAGYFGESDIDYTINVLHSFWTFDFEGTTHSSVIHSEYKGDDPVINFDSTAGQNVTFVSWNPTFQSALNNFDYVEFSNHNRTYFNRYEIYRANRTGDDIRVEFYQDLEEDVPTGTIMHLYTAPHPAGYFIRNVSLFGGSNRISAWGVDQADNEGAATNDWITAPYPDIAPVAPEFWPLPGAFRDDENLTVIGFINESSLGSLNMTINFNQDDRYNFVSNRSFKSATHHRDSTLTRDMPVNSSLFYINSLDYNEINATLNWTDLWVGFSNHNRTHWKRYNVTGAVKYPGTDPIVNITPALEENVYGGFTVASFYNTTYRQGWFNITVPPEEVYWGMNRMYGVAIRGSHTEGYPSPDHYIYKDWTPPQFNLTGTLDYYHTRYPAFSFNVSDDYKLNISTLQVNLSNGTWSMNYSLDDINCTDISANMSLYDCSFTLNRTENGTYNATFEVYDLAGWPNLTWKNVTVLVTTIDIIDVNDQDDITNDAWLYFNWTYTSLGGALDRFEFALGTEPYPDPDFDSVKGWNSTCEVFGGSNCAQDWVNFTHDMNASDLNATELKMMTGTVYYLTVRAKNKAGAYGANKSSDGILFIDQTPPAHKYVDDHGPWTDSDSQLSAEWLFEDNESDIIEYMYTLGTAPYPQPGYTSIKPQTLVGQDSVINDALSLDENETYYYSVKARNGNVAMNYSGSWSGWYSSPGITVDTMPPSGGFIEWQNQTYSTSGFVTIHYYVGADAPGTSDNVKGMIQYGRGALTNDVCPVISDFDWYNTSDVLTGESYRDVNVTTGYCYVFRLFAWDNASNGVVYNTPNETLRIVKADETPPTDVAPVVDDGFYTNDRTSLHADWQDSSDPESGFDYYHWRIVEQPTAGGDHCVVNRTGLYIGTNCSEVTADNTTVSEVSINRLNLTHNHKYFFEVRAWNRAGLNSTTRYSDGIIYLDNAPPGNISILSVNNVTETSSPYYTEDRTNIIEILAMGDLNGYNDIDNCVVLNYSIDYTEDAPYAVNCTEIPHAYYDDDYPDVTFINCTRNTTTSEPLEGTWTWYISCRDHYWNTQTFADSTGVEFTVDWPDPPVFDELFITSPVDSDDDVFCDVTVHDPDGRQNLDTTLKFMWYDGNALVRTEYLNATNIGNNSYSATDLLSYNYTRRGNAITCRVNATDDEGAWRNESASVVVDNFEPYDLYMVSPDLVTVNNDMSFSWIGPYDDIDDDFMTLEIQVDNETSFNASDDNTGLKFGPVNRMTVGGTPIPSIQRNADVYTMRIVYEDYRSGNWDIYMYDVESDTETPISTAAGDQTNPRIYGDYVAYESGGTVYLYDTDTAVTEQVVSGITPGTMDMFGRRIVYHDGAGVRMKDIGDLSTEISVYTTPTATDVSIYGRNIVWTNSADNRIWIYDISNESASLTSLEGEAFLFGYFLANEEGTSLNITNMMDSSLIELQGYNASIYGNKIAYENASGGITVTDLLSSDAFNASIGAGDNPVIYDKLLVYENVGDLWYAVQNITLPSRWIVEGPISPTYVYGLDSTSSPDDTYAWRIRGCDNAFMNNSCIFGQNLTGAAYSLFTIDNTPPVISSLSPADGSIVAGEFRAYANIVDNLGADAVDYANYTITYTENGSVHFSGDMTRSGTVWMSDWLDFTDISLANFTLTVQARDFMGNWNSASSDFTINNATPWFLFGGRGGTEIIDGVTAFNDSIDSDFVAFTVLDSSIRIVGPLPSTTQRFKQSKTNLTVTIHNYSDPVSTLTWPGGVYRAEFTGENLDGSTAANRTFYVDHRYPLWSDNMTVPGDTVYADDALVLSINWTDLTLQSVNFTYNNTNISNSTHMFQVFNTSVESGVFNSSGIPVASYINNTFYWMSGALDGLGRTNGTGWFSVFVNSTPPQVTGTIPDMDVDEDTYLPVASLDLSAYFTDPDTTGTWAYLDNLTYSMADNCTDVAFTWNPSTGEVYGVTAGNNYTGDCMVSATANDYYGASASTNFTLEVNPVPDPPTITPIPLVVTEEDNASGINYSLSGNAYDVDGDSIDWLMPVFDSSVFNLSSGSFDLATGEFNFTLVGDAYGVYNITFRLTDGTFTVERDAIVNVTPVNDAPEEPSVLTPLIGTDNKGMILITWSAYDVDNGTLWFSLEYTEDGGASWNVINDSIFNDTSYDWNSSDFVTEAANTTLRLNASDSEYTKSREHGNFSIDNLPPQLTIHSPTRIVVGNSFTANISTHEPADCSFVIDGTGTPVTSGTTHTTAHIVGYSGLEYNRTYNMSIVCTDSIMNQNETYTLFEPRVYALEFISIRASPSWAYVGQDVNLTLEVASNQTLSDVLLNITAPSGSPQQFDEGNFTPTIDENNKVAYLNGLQPVDTSEIGQYTLTVLDLDNGAMTLGPLSSVNIFEVFTAINQTLNVK